VVGEHLGEDRVVEGLLFGGQRVAGALLVRAAEEVGVEGHPGVAGAGVAPDAVGDVGVARDAHSPASAGSQVDSRESGQPCS
jgi:hypothetical protein